MVAVQLAAVVAAVVAVVVVRVALALTAAVLTVGDAKEVEVAAAWKWFVGTALPPGSAVVWQRRQV
jgi:hypothetical protein